MKCLIAAFIGLFSLVNAHVFSQTLKNKHVLIFSKTAGYRHASIANGKQMFLQLAVTEKFKADTTEDASVFNTSNLEKYDVVVFLSTTGDVLNANEQKAFQEFIRSGKSFLGIHGAADTEYDWPWYNQLSGAYFSDHPEPQKASYINLDSTHPATSFWPVIFNRFEEIYNFKSVQKNALTFLLAVDESSYKGGKMPDFHPAAWCHEFEGGKSFYTALGHHPETYADSDFRKHIIGALRWLVVK